MDYKMTFAMSEESSIILEGGISATMIAFLQKAVLRMIPYALPALVLVALDLVYGIKAANHRGEKVRLSTALRRTITKIFSYICWLVLASTIALAFSKEWLEWLVLGVVFANEFLSIIGNYLETKGLEISWKNVNKALFHFGAQKAGLDDTGIDPNSFVQPIKKPKSQPVRNAKGQFTKKK